MSRRAWTIVLSVVAVVAVALIVLVVALSGADEPSASPTPTPTVTPTSDTPASPTPAPTTTSGDATPATCQTTSTAQFQAMMAQNGWISWETQDQQIGARPFDGFPGGSPEGAIVCRWGVSPDLATDNVIDLAWAPIAADAATAAQQQLASDGYQRIDAAEGMYLALPAQGGVADAEGFGDTYLFTGDDVRWATTKADVAYVKAPDEAG